MISAAGVGAKEYLGVFEWSGARPVLHCPGKDCGGAELGWHGRYERYLGGVLRPICRAICRRCGVTHAVLPEDVCAYNDLMFRQLEQVVDAGGPSSGAVAAGLQGESAPRCARRFRQKLARNVARAMEALLPAVEGDWFSRGKRVVGRGIGVLAALRHWLMSRYSIFLAGPSGLYRFGRPGHRIRATTTDLGSFRRE